MAGEVVACPHCNEEMVDFLVKGEIEVYYSLDTEDYTVQSVKNEKYLCAECSGDCTRQVIVIRDGIEEDE